MIRLLRLFLSPERIVARLERILESGIKADDHQRTASIFCRSLKFLLREGDAHLLSDFVLSHSSKIDDFALVEELISSSQLKEVVNALEENRSYVAAFTICDRLGYDEKASQLAESMGDLERALDLAVDPERKLKLFIRLDRFLEARDLAATLTSPGEYFDLIKESARERMEVKIRARDFRGALALADAAECDGLEREEIASQGREHLDRKIASATSGEEIQSIYQARVDLEEKAGHYDEAGRLAEEVLGNSSLASFLYEKANLFNRAIEAASGQTERLAELHEKGGSLLKAAKHYEAAGRYDRAAVLYERTQYFDKALECYRKTRNPLQDVLIRLHKEAGEFEKAIDAHLASGSLADLEEALSIATSHNLTSYLDLIEERMAELVSGSESDLEQFYISARDDVSDTYCQTIGVDFGTTNSVVAVFNNKTQKAEVVRGPNRSPYVPSFFGLDENHHPVFGETARLRLLTAPDFVVSRVKRTLGERRTFSVGGTTYRSEEIVATLLRHLLSSAEAYVQSKVEERFREMVSKNDLRLPAQVLNAFVDKQKEYNHVGNVVLSVPAYFNDNQKRATRDSAEVAGIRVRRLMHEPSAAALAYTYQKSYSGKLAVVDLGGGTLDISIVDTGDGVSEVQAIGGDTRLGGSDIDAVLVQAVIEDVRQRWGVDLTQEKYSQEIRRLEDACENLKINLSSVPQDTLVLQHFLNRPRYEFELTRLDLEHLSRPILDRIQSTIEETMSEYGSTIDNYILVGNATKMPAFRDIARSVFSARPLADMDPGTVVAMGAALQGATLAGVLTKVLLVDVVPYSLGIQVVEPERGETVISRLIERNATIPLSESDTYTTTQDGQTAVRVKVFQGESPRPQENYFLKDFILDRIPPAPAGTPQIEVTFDIDSDCILKVTALDTATRYQQAVTIEGAVALSRQEKENLHRYFVQREELYSLQRKWGRVRSQIEELETSCNEAIRAGESAVESFFRQFHEKMEVSPESYGAELDHIEDIQAMFIQKEEFAHGIPPKYRDRLASILASVQQVEETYLDSCHGDIPSELGERLAELTHYKHRLEATQASVEKNVTAVVKRWTRILESMHPDLERMDPIELGRYHLASGRPAQARDTLERLTARPERVTREAFNLLLACYERLGLYEAYSDTHQTFGPEFGLIYPAFDHLNTYLKAVDESVFMIRGRSREHQVYSGSGFAVAPNTIVTNRHVVEEMVREQIVVVGKHTNYRVDQIDLDPINDLAVLRVSDELKPLRLGAFRFVEPGEQVVALGFPDPSSSRHSENIYISKGIINSIRKIDASSERVIFIDTKIGGGMSGGPLINALGEVVGIITLIHYRILGPRVDTTLIAEDQPIALPIDLAKRYVASAH